jgi:hypothetical protein
MIATIASHLVMAAGILLCVAVLLYSRPTHL